MSAYPLQSAPCGNQRPNCRALATTGSPRAGLCQIHSAWCPDDYHPAPRPTERSALDQRSYRTGG
jgi:hypothetical protein